MTEEQKKPSWYDEMKELLTDPVRQHLTWNGRTTDWFLEEQVRMVNTHSITFGITLSTPAGMITGQLISAKEYFKLYAESFSASFPGDTKESIREFYERYGQQPEAKEDEEEMPYQFLHLKGARLCTPSGMTPTGEGLLWRGTIASVSGFSLGELIKS
ncbi:hypothetical protein N5D83_24610 [Pseudomonas chengduensis]|nr:gas vesicle accessory protein GvpU [Pseudomonas chengduensis]MDH1869974.1 hypothetical protein [Pseudomonas chengduensis]